MCGGVNGMKVQVWLEEEGTSTVIYLYEYTKMILVCCCVIAERSGG